VKDLFFTNAQSVPTMSGGGAAYKLDGADIDTTGSPTPTGFLGANLNPSAVAFDATGDLWLVSLQNHTLNMYNSAAQMATKGAAPSVTINLPTNAVSIDIAFDNNGNLYVPDLAQDRLYVYTPSQLGASGSPTPTYVYTVPQPFGVALDKSSNVYLGLAASDQIAVYAPITLQNLSAKTRAVPTPVAVLSSNGVGVTIAFDSSGNLWTTDPNGFEEFTAAELAALATNSSPTPAVTIAYRGMTPSYLAFDQNGNLWVGYSTNPLSIIRFPAAAITPGGSGTPDIILTPNVTGGGSTIFSGLALSPIPSNLPLRSARAPKTFTQKGSRR
jgi:hypothetical protein